MIQVGEILGFGFQGRLGRERGAATRLIELLREKMDGPDRVVRRRSLGQRLGLTGGIGCCGGTWGLRPNNISVREDDEDEGPREQETEAAGESETEPGNGSTPACLGQVSGASGMNLAAALAAERHFRAVQDSSPSPVRAVSSNDGVNRGSSAPSTPYRVSLMRLLEETDGCDGEMEKGDSMCCVCMGRKKGAAFIPCGHTFCRGCSRELWSSRGFCPLCNRSIMEILDIF